jgi:purine-binding chemotaxis protein CheW
VTRVELKRRASPRADLAPAVLSLRNDALERVFVVHVGEETMGLPIERVRTVFMARDIASAPLTPPWVRGLVNLRGTVVTAISLRARLGLSERPPEECGAEGELAIAVEAEGESFALLVDYVGDVAHVAPGSTTIAPAGMSELARRLTACVYALPSGLLPIIDLRAVIFDDPAPSIP